MNALAPPPLPTEHAAPATPPPLPDSFPALEAARVLNGHAATPPPLPPTSKPNPKDHPLGRPTAPGWVRVLADGTEIWWIPAGDTTEPGQWVKQNGTGSRVTPAEFAAAKPPADFTAAHDARVKAEMEAKASPDPQPATPDSDAINIEATIARYIQLRDELDALKAKQTEERAPFVTEMDAIEVRIMEAMDKVGTTSMSVAGVGTAFKATESSATIADMGAFTEYVIANKAWSLADWRANKTTVREFIKEQRVPPPGVNFRTEVVVQIRRPTGTGNAATKSRAKKNTDTGA